jgi:hypothetical protein
MDLEVARDKHLVGEEAGTRDVGLWCMHLVGDYSLLVSALRREKSLVERGYSVHQEVCKRENGRRNAKLEALPGIVQYMLWCYCDGQEPRYRGRKGGFFPAPARPAGKILLLMNASGAATHSHATES